MVKIVRTAENIEGIPAGFPILFDLNMAIIEAAFAYLLEHAVVLGRSRTSDTVRTYAEHLYDWFDALEQSGLDWRAADEATIAGYRNRMLEGPSPHTGRPYARATINDRVRTVCRFYAWAHRRGQISEVPFRLVDVRVRRGNDGMLAHLKRGPSIQRAYALTLSEHERLPRPLRVDELRRMFSCLAPPYDLMASWALGAGLRRKEICGLDVEQVPDTRRFDLGSDPLVGVALKITKGDRPRAVYPPLRLVDRTQWYIGEARAALVKMKRKRKPGFKPAQALFLNQRGQRMTRARLTTVFGEAFAAAGLVGSLHWLRHTFAMTMLVRLQREAVRDTTINPLKIVQVLLGHASIETTAIYLRCVELHGDALAESLDYLYGELIGDA
jgi:site-specific recombinase XerD